MFKANKVNNQIHMQLRTSHHLRKSISLKQMITCRIPIAVTTSKLFWNQTSR